ncbi:hypothetical protein C8R47DRAFT_1077458 [Mycena vitilis]|nr:hypothetical protein C8R47DRAFT_1077458 [Mycena vitilis]
MCGSRTLEMLVWFETKSELGGETYVQVYVSGTLQQNVPVLARVDRRGSHERGSSRQRLGERGHRRGDSGDTAPEEHVVARSGSEIGSNLNRTELNARFRFKVRGSVEPNAGFSFVAIEVVISTIWGDGTVDLKFFARLNFKFKKYLLGHDPGRPTGHCLDTADRLSRKLCIAQDNDARATPLNCSTVQHCGCGNQKPTENWVQTCGILFNSRWTACSWNPSMDKESLKSRRRERGVPEMPDLVPVRTAFERWTEPERH